MTKLEKILEQYEDFELAFLVKYKFNSYLETSKQAITSELSKRELTKEKLENLIAKYEHQRFHDSLLRCPRCFSTKIGKDSVVFWNTYGRIGLADNIAVFDGMRGKETYKEKLTCMVCDFVINDPNSGGIIALSDAVSRFFQKIWENITNKNRH